MKKVIVAVLFCLPFLVRSQSSDKGIQWVKGLDFDQVKQKAKTENKFVLLDCYTTWCSPCKEMDAKVYPVESVGEFINQNFIPVKVQFDKTAKDDPSTKLWYKEIPSLTANYFVDGYPTFIFLSPKGDLVFRQSGGTQADGFIKLAKEAMDPNNGFKDRRALYRNLRNEYKKGNIKPDSLWFLLQTQPSSSLFSSDDIYLPEWNKKYRDYLGKALPHQRYSKDNIRYWEYLPLKIDDPVLQYCIDGENQIDSKMNSKGFTSGIISRAILEQIAIPFFNEQKKDSTVDFNGMNYGGDKIVASTEEADWKELEKRIAKHFDKKIAERFVLRMKMEWYGKHHNDEGKIAVSMEQLRNNYTRDIAEWGNSYALNNIASNKFMKTTNADTLEKMAQIMEIIVENGVMGQFGASNDTYATLLYKLGKKDEAIAWEKKAAALDTSFKKIVTQMKNDYPIYADWGANWEGVNHVTWKGFVYPKSVEVKDERSNPIENVTIENVRSKLQKQTNKKGNSSIDVMLGDKIIIYKNGYAQQEVVVTKSSDPFQVVLKNRVAVAVGPH